MVIAFVKKFWKEIAIIALVVLFVESAISYYSDSLPATESNLQLFAASQLLLILAPLIIAAIASFLIYRRQQENRLLFLPVIAITISGIIMAAFFITEVMLVSDEEWALRVLESTMPLEDSSIDFLKFFEISSTVVNSVVLVGSHCGFALIGSFIGKRVARKY